MVDANRPGMEDSKGSPGGLSIPLSDAPLLDLLDALVNDRGKVAAAEALGVNYRTMMVCYESRRVSRRMRRALEEHRDAVVDDGDEQGDEGGGVAEKVASLEERVMALEKAHGALVETVEAQAKRLAELERRAEVEEEGERQLDEADASEVEEEPRGPWRPPRRDHGLPDAGVVTLEEQRDETHAFGPAAPLVAEWRGLRTGAVISGGRVARANAAVRRWELEVELLRDFHLTLPPETEPLDASRREDHLRWRREALAVALAKERRLRWLRRALTLGLRWR